MKRGVFWVILCCLIVASLVLTSCGTSTTTTQTTPASTTTSTALITTTSTSTPVNSSSTTSAVVTSSATTTSTGNWWDSLGLPQYGGTMTLQAASNIVNFDPYSHIPPGWNQSTRMTGLLARRFFLTTSVIIRFNFRKEIWPQAGNLPIQPLL